MLASSSAAAAAALPVPSRLVRCFLLFSMLCAEVLPSCCSLARCGLAARCQPSLSLAYGGFCTYVLCCFEPRPRPRCARAPPPEEEDDDEHAETSPDESDSPASSGSWCIGGSISSSEALPSCRDNAELFLGVSFLLSGTRELRCSWLLCFCFCFEARNTSGVTRLSVSLAERLVRMGYYQ